MKDVSALVDPVRQGSRLALGRLLTQVENDTEEGRQALVRLFPFTGQSSSHRCNRGARHR